MDNKTCISCIIKSNFTEIDDVISYINEKLQSTFSGLDLTNRLESLLNEISTEYDIYRNAYEYGHIKINADGCNVPVQNALTNLKKAYEYFKNPPIIKIVAPVQTSEIKTQHNNSYSPPITDWLTLDEVCKEFRLSKNNIKSRQWRDKNNFPYHQDGGAYSSIQYNRTEITEWMKRNKKC